MSLLHRGHELEMCCYTRKSLFLSHSGKLKIHVGPLFMLAGSGLT